MKHFKHIKRLNVLLFVLALLLTVVTLSPTTNAFVRQAFALIGNITGEGNINYIARFASGASPTNEIGDSSIYEDIAGNIGIDQVSPGAKLSVGGDAAGTVSAQITNTTYGSSFNDGLVLGVNTTDAFINFRNNGDSGTGDLRFLVNSSERMRITDSGNVGIRTGSPKGVLHVMGGGSGVVSVNASADELILERNANAGLSILSPAANSGNIAFADPGSPNAGLINYHHPTNAMRFFTNATEKVRITSAGLVGIGTVAPGAKLHISATAGGDEIRLSDAAPQIRFDDTNIASGHTGKKDYWLHVNNNTFYILYDSDDNGGWNAPHPLYISNRTVFFGQSMRLMPQTANPPGLANGMMWMMQ